MPKVKTKVTELTDEELIKIGQAVRNALDGNMLVGSFAAELVGESYPFSKAMWEVVFQSYKDKELGKRFTAWCDESNAKR